MLPVPPVVNRTGGRHARPTAHHWWPDATAIGLYVALAVAAYAHAWAGGTTRVVGLVGRAGSDPIQQLWFLSWTPFAILHGHDPLFTGYANVPHGVNLVTNTGEQLLGLVSWPVNVLFGPITALNAMFTLAFATSAGAGYVLARRFTTWRPAAFVAGLLYGFSPYVVGQATNHLDLALVPLPPLIFLVLERMMVDAGRGRPVRWGLLLGALVVAQFFISSEILTDTAVISLLGVIVLGLLYPGQIRPRWRRFAAGLGVAAVLAGVLLAFPIVEGLTGPAHVTGAIQLAPQAYRADALGIIVPGRTQLLAPSSLLKVSDRFVDGNSIENGAYLGIPLLAVLLGGLVALRSRVMWFITIMVACAWILSLGSRLVVSGAPTAHPVSGLWLPEVLFTKLPILSNTEPIRYSLFAALFAAPGLAIVLDHLRARWPKQSLVVSLAASAGVAAVAAVALVPLIPALPYAASTAAVPRFFTSSAVQIVPAGSTVLLYPYPQYQVERALPMLWQVRSDFRFRILGGYFIVPAPRTGSATANSPNPIGVTLGELYTGYPVLRTPILRSVLRNELRTSPVSTVVAEPLGKDPAAAISFLTWMIGRPPDRVAGAEVWTHVT
jgi:hypothetical protein